VLFAQAFVFQQLIITVKKKRCFSGREVPLFDSKRTASRPEKRRFSAAAPSFVKETDNQKVAELTLPHHSLLRVRVNAPS